MPGGNEVETPASKKVRLACRRCRAKRVKCDGGIPACGNCTRAGVPCVDVDGRNAGLSIPRDYAGRCLSRIRWLEESIKLLDPEFDLSQGPNVESYSTNSSLYIDESMSRIPRIADRAARPESLAPTDHTPEFPHRKRSYASLQASDREDVPSIEARSVAMDLGMISLHSDSRQQSYLGSSSGVLFTKLIGTENILLSQNQSATSKFASQRGQDLPEPQEARTLFGVYFQEIHIDYPFLDPPSIINAYNTLVVCANRGYANKTDRNGWIEDIPPFSYNDKLDKVGDRISTPISFFTAVFHVFMVFSLAATLLTRNKNFDFSPTPFYKVALTAGIEGISTISLAGLQSILLLTMQGMIGPADFNIWTLSHIAVSHCIDLGLHREPRATADGSLAALFLKRLIFYTVYKLDRTISTIQGRPLGIRYENFDIQLPDPRGIRYKSASIVGGHDSTCLYPQRPNDLEISIHQFKLDQYVSEIKLLFYHLHTNDRVFNFSRDHTENQMRLKAALDSWIAETQKICSRSVTHGSAGEEAIRPNCEHLKLELLYHSALTLLHQPSQSIPHPTQPALHVCYESSRKRIHIYNQLNDEQNLFYNWRDIHGIFASGATIIFCFWSSPEIQSMTPLAEALYDLRTCSNLLSIGGQWWPSVRGGKESFDKLVDLTIKRLSNLQNNNGSSAHSRIQSQPRYAHDSLLRPDSASYAEETEQISSSQTPRGNTGYQVAYDEPEVETMDTFMDSFFSDYLQGDWSWDPFSTFSTTDL